MSVSSRLTLRASLGAATTVVALAALTACGGSSSGSTTDAADGAAPSASASGAASGAAGGSGQDGTRGRMPGASGQIAAKQGTTLQVQNQTDGQVAVSYTGKTAISAQVAATLKDVKVGGCVTVTPVTSASDGSDTTTQPTSITAATVRITAAVDGSCTGGFGSGLGGGFGGDRPSGAPSGMPTTRPTDLPSGGPGGNRGMFGANGKVTAVSASGFTVASSFPRSTAGASTGASGDSGQPTTATITVAVNGSTTYTTTRSADASALKVGKCVVATGQSDDTGAVAAQRLVVSDPVDGSCTTGFGFGGGRGGQAGQNASADASQQGGAA